MSCRRNLGIEHIDHSLHAVFEAALCAGCGIRAGAEHGMLQAGLPEGAILFVRQGQEKAGIRLNAGI